MTNYQTIVVSLEPDLGSDQVDQIKQAIQMIRGVDRADVARNEPTTDRIVRDQIQREVVSELMKTLKAAERASK